MGFSIVEVPMLSGDKCRIFSILMDGDDETLYEQFSEAYWDDYKSEVQDIYNRLMFIGHEGGARLQFLRNMRALRGMASLHCMTVPIINCGFIVSFMDVCP